MLAKAKAGWRAGLTAIICVGETGAGAQGRSHAGYRRRPARRFGAGRRHAENTVIAYEPVWAIGTGLTPTAGDVAEVHAFMRDRLRQRFGPAGDAMRLLYGGSVKPANAEELMAVENVDGALVGGASLKSADFLAICAACRRVGVSG